MHDRNRVISLSANGYGIDILPSATILMQETVQQSVEEEPEETQLPPPIAANVETAPPEEEGPEDEGKEKAPDSAQWKPKKRGARKPVLALVILIVIGSVGYFAYKHFMTVTTINYTTTIPMQKVTTLASCTAITSPGTYQLESNISTKIGKGACISIESSDVKLLGNNFGVYGNGPFSSVQPFTYGISIAGVRNISVENLRVSKFSYGMRLEDVKASVLLSISITNVSVSGLYLGNSTGVEVDGSYIYGAEGSQGGLDIIGGGNNMVTRTVIQNNAYYGMRLNSTLNQFIGDTFRNNGVDLICNASAGFGFSNKFIGSGCDFNDYCSFATCSAQNLAYNISKISLGPVITSCGSILKSGTYRLAGNLSILPYVYPANVFARELPCIKIIAPEVKLDCGGYAIKDANIGIFQENGYGTVISNCNLVNDTAGVGLFDTFNISLLKTNGWDDIYAVWMYGSASGSILNSTYRNNVYGLYLSNVRGFAFRNITAKNNSYGIAFENGDEDTFVGDSLNSNNKGDLYCSASSYNATTDLMQSTSCGVTDCNWATSCRTKVLPPLTAYPINNCATISLPGEYEIMQNIVNKSATCINIKASNVNINCNNKLIVGGGLGNAFAAVGLDNVSIGNCDISGYSNGVFAGNTSHLVLSNMQIRNVSDAVYLNTSSDDRLSNMSASRYSYAGFVLKNVRDSALLNNSALNGNAGSSTGFVFENDTRNIVKGDNATNNAAYGFRFDGTYNNTIMNNSAFTNAADDYYCAGSSMGINANGNGVNHGSTKRGCAWLVELNPLISASCFAVTHSSQILLQQDMLYTYGQTCYNIYDTNTTSADNTVLNCNGHTVMATNGGTFADVENATGVVVENCYIKGFSIGVKGSSQQLSVFNNTVSDTNDTVVLTNSEYPAIKNNTISNTKEGIYAGNSKYGTVLNNRIENASAFGIELFNSSVFDVESNIGMAERIGLLLVNTELSTFKNNAFTGSTLNGLECSGTATNESSLNKDNGDNECSSNYKCYWMNSSPLCRT